MGRASGTIGATQFFIFFLDLFNFGRKDFFVEARRILVVDDNQDSANSMALLLSLYGHTAEARFRGEGVVEEALAFQPDLVLLDIGMPDRSGYDVVREIRAEPRLAKVRVAAISGFGGRSYRASGFDAHFVKPVDFKALEGWIDSL